MDDQTKADNPKSPQQSASRGFATGAGNFAQDVLTLAELQAQLLAIDVRDCRARITVPVVLLLGGFAIAFACCPIGLAAFALCLIQFFNTSYATGFLIAFIVGAILGTLMSIIGWRRVGKRLAVLKRSQHELARNLRWIKTVIGRSRAE